MGEQQQSIDTNVNNLCTRCCKAKSEIEFGEYEMHVYDEELGRTQQVMVTYKSCARCREKTNKYKEEELQQKVDKETKQICSRCLKIKPESDYGEYKTWAFTKDTNPVQEVFLPYKSCKGCRDKERLYNKERRARSYTSDDDSSDTNSSYSDQCVYDAGDYEVGFSNM